MTRESRRLHRYMERNFKVLLPTICNLTALSSKPKGMQVAEWIAITHVMSPVVMRLVVFAQGMLHRGGVALKFLSFSST